MHSARSHHTIAQLNGYTDSLGINDEVVDIARVFLNSHISLVWHCNWVCAPFNVTMIRMLNLNVINMMGRWIDVTWKNCNIYTKMGCKQFRQKEQLMVFKTITFLGMSLTQTTYRGLAQNLMFLPADVDASKTKCVYHQIGSRLNRGDTNVCGQKLTLGNISQTKNELRTLLQCHGWKMC